MFFIEMPFLLWLLPRVFRLTSERKTFVDLNHDRPVIQDEKNGNTFAFSIDKSHRGEVYWLPCLVAG